MGSLFSRSLSLLAILGGLSVSVEAAPIIFQNGTIDGTTGAPRFDSSFAVSNSFVVSAPDTALSITFGVWVRASATLSSLVWSISSGSNGTGTVFGSGTATSFTSTFHNVFNPGPINSYDIYSSNFSLGPGGVSLASGNYFLTLSNGVASDARQVGWDFAVGGTSTAFQFNGGPPNSTAPSFFIVNGPSPAGAPELEPTRALMPVLFCAALLAGLARRRSRLEGLANT